MLVWFFACVFTEIVNKINLIFVMYRSSNSFGMLTNKNNFCLLFLRTYHYHFSVVQNDLVHGWGMDMKLGYCAQVKKS